VAAAHFERRGAARYLSHLDTARALQRLSRAGCSLPSAQGMRPKPRSAWLAVLVGVAGSTSWPSPAGADQTEPGARDLVAKRSRWRGGRLAPLASKMEDQRSLRLEPVAAQYKCLVPAGRWRSGRPAAAEYALADAAPVERVSPKGANGGPQAVTWPRSAWSPAAEGAALLFQRADRADCGAARRRLCASSCARAGAEDAVPLVDALNVVYDGLPVGLRRESDRT